MSLQGPLDLGSTPAALCQVRAGIEAASRSCVRVEGSHLLTSMSWMPTGTAWWLDVTENLAGAPSDLAGVWMAGGERRGNGKGRERLVFKWFCIVERDCTGLILDPIMTVSLDTMDEIHTNTTMGHKSSTSTGTPSQDRILVFKSLFGSMLETSLFLGDLVQLTENS